MPGAIEGIKESFNLIAERICGNLGPVVQN